MNTEIIWRGAGWYGPLAERAGAFGPEVIPARVNTDAGRDDPFQAGRDAYGQVGTPDWYDPEKSFASDNPHVSRDGAGDQRPPAPSDYTTGVWAEFIEYWRE